VTSTATLPSSVNGTTPCIGCKLRCASAFVFTLSAEDSGRYSPGYRRRNAAIASLR